MTSLQQARAVRGPSRNVAGMSLLFLRPDVPRFFTARFCTLLRTGTKNTGGGRFGSGLSIILILAVTPGRLTTLLCRLWKKWRDRSSAKKIRRVKVPCSAQKWMRNRVVESRYSPFI
jgi:hypothetical protein